MFLPRLFLFIYAVFCPNGNRCLGGQTLRWRCSTLVIMLEPSRYDVYFGEIGYKIWTTPFPHKMTVFDQNGSFFIRFPLIGSTPTGPPLFLFLFLYVVLYRPVVALRDSWLIFETPTHFDTLFHKNGPFDLSLTYYLSNSKKGWIVRK